MTFTWPVMLLSLLFLPLAVLLYLMLLRRRQRLAALYSRLAARQARPGFRRHIPPLFFLSGIALLLIALARPQAIVSLPKIEGTVILAFDVSGSMAAEDLAPSRMDAAKSAAHAFVDRQPESVKIGVVAFSDSGLSVQAPTNNQESIHASINRLTPQRGTSLAHGIIASINTIAESYGVNAPKNQAVDEGMALAPTSEPLPQEAYTSAVIVLLTDGENNLSPDPITAAAAAAERGVRIYTIGVGSSEGATVNIEGFSVHTRLDEQMLQQIADLTGGAYFQAENEEDLRTIYDEINLQLVIKPEKMEVTSIFTGASVLILLVGGLFSLIWFSRIP